MQSSIQREPARSRATASSTIRLEQASADTLEPSSSPSTPPPPSSHNINSHPSQYTSSPSMANSSMFSKIHIPKPNQTNLDVHEPIAMSKDMSTSDSTTKSSSFSPNASSFSPNASGEEVAMPTIDESETKSKLDTNHLDDHYSADSMYYSDDTDHDRPPPEGAQSPSLSIQHCDKAQLYKQFGPRIKLSAEDSLNNIRYSGLSHSRKLSNLSTFPHTGHNRGRVGSSGVNLALNPMNSDKGYGSDGSDESISMVSQSYGAYIFDPHYQSKLPAPWSKGPKLQSWHSRTSSMMSDSEHNPVVNMLADRMVGSVVSTVVRSESDADQIPPLVTAFRSDELNNIRCNDWRQKAMSVTQLITTRHSSDDIEEDEKHEIERRDTFEVIDSIMNDDMAMEDKYNTLPTSDTTLKLMSRNSNIILEDQEMEEHDLEDMKDDEKDGIVVMKNAYNAYRPQRLYGAQEDSDSSSGCNIVLDDDLDDDKICTPKIAVPLPDYQDMSIHQIMDDDIMQNKIGYHQFDQSCSLDELCDDINLEMLSMVDIEPPVQNRGTETNGLCVVQHIKQEPLEHYINTLQTNEAYFEDMHEIDSTANEYTHRRLVLLQNINVSLKQTIQQQIQQIESLKAENLQIKQDFEEYKMKEVNAHAQEHNTQQTENTLHREMFALKQELEQTRHKLLQYEIFDEHSELDIQALLCSMDSEELAMDLEEKEESKEKQHRNTWSAIEYCIKTGDKAYVDKLIKFTKIAMNEKEPINCFKMLECATRYNNIDMVHQLISSYIGVKLGNKLLSYRYDDGQDCGVTILMIAVTHGYLDIANDLLDYYEYNAVDYSDKNKVFEYLNMADRNGVTLLMKACQTDKVKIVQWVLNQYLLNKIQLKTLIEARDTAGNGIFDGYIRTQAIENAIHEYAPLIK
eukprot:12204_1